MFMNKIKEILDKKHNINVTKNGAVGYGSSGKYLLDINFNVSSLRNESDGKIIIMFKKAFYENKNMAIKWLFFMRDIRGGMGERKLFRIILNDLATSHPEIVSSICDLIPIYGRYDDLECLLFHKTHRNKVINIIESQLNIDLDNMENNKHISLLAKWLPSINASSTDTMIKALVISECLGMTHAEYRKTLSKLRRYLDVVEVKMSSNRWNEIKYETVPSKANLIYNTAFLKHDMERRQDFLQNVQKGEIEINSNTLLPHDIVHKYHNTNICGEFEEDIALEEMWKALPTVDQLDDTIVVSDGSSSMWACIQNTNISALTIAISLSIYFSERLYGQFKDKFITFSSNPQLVDLSKCINLKEKIEKSYQYNEISNINIETTFDLILATAIQNDMTQEELPKNILILSDMEFDPESIMCTTRLDNMPKLFDVLKEKYESYGYKLPRLIFWNILSRSNVIPIKENDLGIVLISGFSPNIIKMVTGGKLDPYECLVDILNSERYQILETRLLGIV